MTSWLVEFSNSILLAIERIDSTADDKLEEGTLIEILPELFSILFESTIQPSISLAISEILFNALAMFSTSIPILTVLTIILSLLTSWATS